jgi:lysophospholipase L1-like esterase
MKAKGWQFWLPAGGAAALITLGITAAWRRRTEVAIANGTKKPPPPSKVIVPAGWYRLPEASVTPAMTSLAEATQAKSLPLGDVQEADIDGKHVGAFTEWHWDNHQGGVYKWHHGVSMLARSIIAGNVLLLGDSLAVGLKSHFPMLGQPVKPEAVIGTTVEYWASGQGLPATNRDLADKPSLVLVSLGGNDAFVPRVNAADIANKATVTLVQKIHDAGAKLVWIGPPSLPPEYGGRKPDPRVLMRIREAVLADPANRWIDATGLHIPRSGDQLHPTADGYHLWAQYIIDELQRPEAVA